MPIRFLSRFFGMNKATDECVEATRAKIGQIPHHSVIVSPEIKSNMARRHANREKPNKDMNYWGMMFNNIPVYTCDKLKPYEWHLLPSEDAKKFLEAYSNS